MPAGLRIAGRVFYVKHYETSYTLAFHCSIFASLLSGDTRPEGKSGEGGRDEQFSPEGPMHETAPLISLSYQMLRISSGFSVGACPGQADSSRYAASAHRRGKSPDRCSAPLPR